MINLTRIIVPAVLVATATISSVKAETSFLETATANGVRRRRALACNS